MEIKRGQLVALTNEPDATVWRVVALERFAVVIVSGEQQQTADIRNLKPLTKEQAANYAKTSERP